MILRFSGNRNHMYAKFYICEVIAVRLFNCPPPVILSITAQIIIPLEFVFSTLYIYRNRLSKQCPKRQHF